MEKERIYLRSRQFACLALFAFTTSILLFSGCRSSSEDKPAVLPVTFIAMDSALFTNDGRNYTLRFDYADSNGIVHSLSLLKGKTGLWITHPTAIKPHEDGTGTIFIICPGDRIELRAQDDGSLLLVEKGSKRRTDELNFFKDLIDSTGFSRISERLAAIHATDSISLVAQQINDLKVQRLRFLDRYAIKHPLQDDFRKTAVDYINEFALTDSAILFGKAFHPGQNNPAIKNWFLKQIKDADAQEHETLNTRRAAALGTIIQLYLFGRTNLYFQTPEEALRSFDFVDRNCKGKTREYLLFKTLDLSLRLRLSFPPDRITRFRQTCKNEIYVRGVGELTAQRSFSAVLKDADSVLLPDAKTKKAFSPMLPPGHVIVLDFWASWCKPCRKEIPFSKTLQRQYRAKPVSFYYLSIDEDLNAWLNANTAEHIDASQSLLLLDFANTSLVKNYGIWTVPRYMVVNKQGALVNDNAPTPSDTSLKKLIDKLLTE